MILNIKNRNIRVGNADNQISCNSDYVAEFRFDEEWNGKIKTARFAQNGKHFDVILTDDRCEIPPLKTGFVRVGVFSDAMTSTYAEVYFKSSIKDGSGNPAEPPEDVYAQLTALIESGMLKGADGLTPYVGENNNWWIGDVDTGILARGTDGYTPVKGVDYFDGAKGDKGDKGDPGTDGSDAAVTADNIAAALGYNPASEQQVDSLRSDLTGLQTVVDSKANKSDLDKTNLSLDTLWKMNRGQTYDVLEQESEAYSVDVPSGSRYVGIDEVGGKSVVWNQIAPTNYYFRNGIYANYSDGIISLKGTATDNHGAIADMPTVAKHYYYLRTKTIANPNSITLNFGSLNKLGAKPIADVGKSVAWISYQVETFLEGIGFVYVDVGNSLDGIQLQLLVFDLTQMFGAGNEPSTVEEFEAMFPNDYYPYCEPTIISSQTDRVDVASADGTISQQITTNFPVLNSAGSVYDYIDLNEGKLHQRVGLVDLGAFNWNIFTYGESIVFRSYDYTGKKPLGSTYVANIICSDYESASASDLYSFNKDKAIAVHNGAVGLMVTDSSYTDTTAFNEAMSGVMLYYELAEEIITDITIPTELSDWLTVEAGGSITFHNADEGKRLLIPNKLSFIRKLDEVTV